MKSKQLANVLIKILGLSVCLHAVPSFISGIIVGLTQLGASSKVDVGLIRLLSSAIGAAVQAAVGLFIITRSRAISEFLFRHDHDPDA